MVFSKKLYEGVAQGLYTGEEFSEFMKERGYELLSRGEVKGRIYKVFRGGERDKTLVMLSINDGVAELSIVCRDEIIIGELEEKIREEISSR